MAGDDHVARDDHAQIMAWSHALRHQAQVGRAQAVCQQSEELLASVSARQPRTRAAHR
jgi:hypothetical protein